MTQVWTYNGEGIICDDKGDVCTNVRPGCESMIVSAPDLLEALELSNSILTSLYVAETRNDAKAFLRDQITRNSAAISKAKGGAG